MLESINGATQLDFNAMLNFFNSGATHPYNFRRDQLLKLKKVLIKYESQLIDALRTDLGKPEFESYMAEISIVYAEIDFALKHLKKWMRKQKVSTPLKLFYSTSHIYKVPLGVVLIIAPWNYPIQLLLSPLVGAISAGNCVVLKPSELMPTTNNILQTIINETFNSNYMAVIDGEGAIVVPQLIDSYPFNHVFFTGSTIVGKSIATQCAQKLIPYTLELGGKSPVIVDKDVDLDVACKRILWGKFLNAGQTCLAPDYVLVHSDIKSEFINKLKLYLDTFMESEVYTGNLGKYTCSYTNILNYKRMFQLQNYLEGLNIIYGGISDKTHLKLMPTLVDEPPLTHDVMHNEIFGPILPIFSYTNETRIYDIISYNPQPLALYIFSNNAKFTERIINMVQFGGGCVNTTLMHFTNLNLPFGGVGNSGQGKYHGKYGFNTFSHDKAIVKMATWFDAFIKYPPYNAIKLLLLKLF